MSTPQQPSVGRIVHYVSYGSPVREDGTQAYTSRCRTATITEVPESLDASSAVGLMVANPTGLFFHPLSDGGCLHSEDEHRGGTWHWPERV